MTSPLEIIQPDEWNEKTGTVVKTCLDGRAINIYIAKLTTDLEKLYNQLSTTGKKVTAKIKKMPISLKLLLDEH